MKKGYKMKNSIFFSLLIFMLVVYTGIIHSQTLHTVEVSNFVFTPANLTVTVNDTVRWININGTHNVVADDNSFTSGPPSSSNWVYDKIFTAEGNNPYYCEVHGGPGGSGMSGVVSVQNPVSIFEQNIVINKFELEQNYPNPFNPSTVIRYQTAQESNVTLTVFNSIGGKVTTLLNEVKPKGTFTVEFNGANLASGIYYLRIHAGPFTDTKKMILLK